MGSLRTNLCPANGKPGVKGTTRFLETFLLAKIKEITDPSVIFRADAARYKCQYSQSNLIQASRWRLDRVSWPLALIEWSPRDTDVACPKICEDPLWRLHADHCDVPRRPATSRRCSLWLTWTEVNIHGNSENQFGADSHPKPNHACPRVYAGLCICEN